MLRTPNKSLLYSQRMVREMWKSPMFEAHRVSRSLLLWMSFCLMIRGEKRSQRVFCVKLSQRWACYTMNTKFIARSGPWGENVLQLKSAEGDSCMYFFLEKVSLSWDTFFQVVYYELRYYNLLASRVALLPTSAHAWMCQWKEKTNGKGFFVFYFEPLQ